MTFKTSFYHGLKLDLPNGKQRRLCACEWHDDPAFVIEGRTLKRFDSTKRASPDHTEELPQGTVVRLWDEEAGDPILGTI